jgi:hypothetical protein
MLGKLPALVLAALLLASSVARAESNDPPSSDESSDPPKQGAAQSGAYLHDGFYYRAAAGPALSSLVATGPSGRTDLNGSTGGMVLVGGTPSRGFVVGGGLTEVAAYGRFVGGVYDGAQVDVSEWKVGPFVDWYPDPTRGFHLGALTGLSVSILRSTTNQSSAALGATIFGGYDWWIGPQWSLGVLAAASGATASSLVDSHLTGTGYRMAPLSLGINVALTFH